MVSKYYNVVIKGKDNGKGYKIWASIDGLNLGYMELSREFSVKLNEAYFAKGAQEVTWIGSWPTQGCFIYFYSFLLSKLTDGASGDIVQQWRRRTDGNGLGCEQDLNYEAIDSSSITFQCHKISNAPEYKYLHKLRDYNPSSSLLPDSSLTHSTNNMRATALFSLALISTSSAAILRRQIPGTLLLPINPRWLPTSWI